MPVSNEEARLTAKTKESIGGMVVSALVCCIGKRGYRVSSNNEACYAATHSARQPEIALNSLVGVGAMTKRI